jgi:hypothetical protein
MRDGAARNCFVGVAKTKAAVTTLDLRLTVIKLQVLELPALEAIEAKLAETHFQTALKEKLASNYTAISLTPKLSTAIIQMLATDSKNGKAIEAAAYHIPSLRKISGSEWNQFDAIKTAMAAFGISKGDFPLSVEMPDESDSTLSQLESHGETLSEEDAHVLEDNVIAKDASVVPGFTLFDKHVTGRAVFYHAGEILEVYTANKGPLEEMLGVDLIYVNQTLGNTVMVQYKMLELHLDPVTAKADWIFRPDGQLREEIARMKLPPITGQIDDYRLHRDPFFFKFVRRKGDGESHQSLVLSFDHLNAVLNSPKCRGPKGGLRVSFDSLEGVYLRDADLVGLIRSGYIGTHRIESDALKPIIQAVSEGNRGLVLAWQRRVQGQPQ